MDHKFTYLLLLIILRAGLVQSIYEIESANTYSNSEDSSKFTPDTCSEFGIISNCTLENPYCFVDSNNLSCGPTKKLGWRISSLDGLILNNGQIPNPNCELFEPPESDEIKRIIMNLLIYSEFGSAYKGRESAWFNIFQDLGNCPLKSKYCDKDLLTCENLLSAGRNCTSSNQCLSHYCEKFDKNAPDDTIERRCAEENNLQVSFKQVDDESGKNGSLLIVVLISVGSAIIILVIILFLIKAQRRKKLLLNSSSKKLPHSDNHYTTINSNQSGFVAKHLSSLSSLRSSLLSRISSRSYYSKNIKRESSDQLSVLLPPPPTLNRDSFLYGDNYNNNDYYYNYVDNVSIMNDRDSFEIYPPNHIQQKYETSYSPPIYEYPIYE